MPTARQGAAIVNVTSSFRALSSDSRCARAVGMVGTCYFRFFFALVKPPRKSQTGGLLRLMVRHVSTTPPASTALRSPTLQRAFAAFTYRDFRVLWFGAFASTVGTWMQKVAQSWLVFDLTKSSFYLGLDDFLGQLPILLFTLLGGVIADRHDRKRLLIGSQFVQMATAFTLAALVFQGRVHIGHILALSFAAGMAQAFGGPAYQAMIPSLIHKKDLPNAIALNSIQFNLARVFGPLFAGVTIATLGAVGCFTLNGVSFLIVIVALMSLSVAHIQPADRKPMLHELKGGLAYARSEPTILALTILAAMTTFLGLPLLTFLPIVRARDLSRRYRPLQLDDGVLGDGRRGRRAGHRLAGALQAHGTGRSSSSS